MLHKIVGKVILIKIVQAVTNDIVTDNRVHKVASTLCNFGYHVTLIGRRFSDSESLLSRPYKTRRFKLWFNKTFLFYANYNLRLFFYLLKVPVDIIVANDLDTLLACWLASKLRKKNLIYDSHELFTEVPELIHRPLVRKFWHVTERLLVPTIKYGYTVSKPIQEHYKQKYGVEFELIRNVGMFQFDNQFKPLPKEPVIIYQGAVNVGRGIELVLQTLKHLEEVKFWVLGNGDKLEELKQMAKALGVESKVKFFGRVKLEALQKYTAKAHIGISLEEDIGLNYRYALPNKIFDYVQARIPVIVSSLPEMKNLVDKSGIGVVLTERRPEFLANEILKLCNNSKLQEDIKQNLELAARDLCWQREEEKVIMLYRRASELVLGHNDE